VLEDFPRGMHELREQRPDLLRCEPAPKVAALEPCQPADALVNVATEEALGRAIDRAAPEGSM